MQYRTRLVKIGTLKGLHDDSKFEPSMVEMCTCIPISVMCARAYRLYQCYMFKWHPASNKSILSNLDKISK